MREPEIYRVVEKRSLWGTADSPRLKVDGMSAWECSTEVRAHGTGVSHYHRCSLVVVTCQGWHSSFWHYTTLETPVQLPRGVQGSTTINVSPVLIKRYNKHS